MKYEGLLGKGFGFVLTLIPSFMLLTLLPLSSLADTFTAKSIGDYGNVTVIETSGNYDADLTEGTVNVQPRQTIAKEFFKSHKDDYDFLAIFTNYDFQLPKDAVAFYQSVKNDVQGIGQDSQYNNTQLYGSNGKLQGTIDMGNLLKLASLKLDPQYQFVLDTLSHEMLHRWGAYVKFRDWNGNISEGLLGYQKAHWSFLLDSGASTHYGNYWQNNGDGTFTSLAARKYYYSPLDLYLMGMIDKSKVPPMLLIENPSIDPTRKPEAGVTITGIPHTVTIDDIIAANGERIPTAKDSQKQFKMAFILAVAPGTFTGEELFPLETIRNGFLTRQSILTDGKLLVEVASTVKDGFPTNPGVRPPASVPRTLPPNINEGSNWLVSHQLGDGSWTDVSLTSERDTAEAVSTLQLFPATQPQFQAGLQWLNNSASSNTDYLARRIEATIKSGGDASSLVQELLTRRNLDGGWGTGRSFVSNPSDTAFALKALAAAKFADQQVISKGISYLQAVQASDGGWSSGSIISLIQPTATVLRVLSSYRNAYSLANNITSAMAFLEGKQNQDGGFGNSPSTVYDSAEAVMAMHEAGTDRAITNKGVEYLLSQQAENGSWQESPYQTALAVRAVWQTNVDPDLSIKTDDITFIAEKITSLPTNAVLNAVVWNLGRTDVSQAKLAVYGGAIVPEKKVAEQVVSIPGMSPVTVTFSIPVTDGNGHLFYVVVDPDNLIKESNKSNNSAAKTLMPEVTYDFEVLASDVIVAPTQVNIGETLKITAKVGNRGTSDAFSVPVRIFIDEQGAPFEIATFTADIPAGGSITKEVMWKTNKPGNGMQLTVQADPSNAFTETSKANNGGAVPVTVLGSTLSNLTVSYKDIAINPATVKQGGDASISVLVRNEGFATAEGVKVNFYDGVANKDGVLLGSTTIPAISAGTSVPASIDWIKIAESGSKVISVLVDPENSIQEFTKDDNFTFTTTSILSLPDLVITNSSIVLTPSAPKEGDVVSIAVTVQNKGEQEATNIAVRISEGATEILTVIIPFVNANSQETATMAYPAGGQKGVHQFSVAVDPLNQIAEQSKANNRATKSFSVQNADLWVSEPYFSPNGDGIKDSTDLGFRLAGNTRVHITAFNAKGEAVRTFSGGELDDTAGTVVTWDGRSDIGTVVADGEYQLQVVEALSGTVLGSLPVVIDNNALLTMDNVNSKYVQVNMLPEFHYSYLSQSWFSDESGFLHDNITTFLDYQYPRSLFNVSIVDGSYKDIFAVANLSANDSYSYYISPDNEKVTLQVNRYVTNLSQILVLNKDGEELQVIRSISNSNEVFSGLRWSPDSNWLQFKVDHYDENTRQFLFADTRLVKIDENVSFTTSQQAADYYWSPNSKKLLLNSGPDFWLVDVDKQTTTPLGSIGQDNSYILSDIEWSPNSDKVACLMRSGNDVKVITFDIKGYKRDLFYGQGYPNRISNYNNSVWSHLMWMQNDKILLWLGKDLWLLAANENENLQLYKTYDNSNDSYVNAVNVSKDGKYIAYAANTPISFFFEISDIQGNKNRYIHDFVTDANPYYYADRLQWSNDSTKVGLIEYTWNNTWDVSDKYVISDVNTKKPVVKNMGDRRGPDDWIDGWLGNEGLIVENMQLSKEVMFNYDTGEVTPFDIVPDAWVYGISPSGNKVLVSKTFYSPNYHRESYSIAYLYNLFADFIPTKTKSGIIIRGTAQDLNFSGYKLEYADVKTPTAWNLIIPPSEEPVVNGDIATWIPPHEGTFFVRLMAWDKAGNTAISKKRVTWGGAKQVIAGIYKDIDLISPKNADGIKDEVKLTFTVLVPAHLEFTIYNEKGELIRTILREYTGYASDTIAWDGRDFANNVVPDGKYTIKLFDYSFTVEVDNTLPDVAIDLGKLIIDSDKVKDVAGLDYPQKAKSSISALIKGHAFDTKLKNWIIEYGEGDNPSEWHLYKHGETNFGKKDADGKIIIPAENEIVNFTYFDEVMWLVGKKLRLTAEDYAGNKNSMVSGYLEDQRLWQAGWNNTGSMYLFKDSLLKIQWPKYESLWHYLDQKILNSSDSRGVILGVYRDNLFDGLAYEALRFPISTRYLQYFKNGSWNEYPIIRPVANGEVKVVLNNIDKEGILAVRFKSLDISGSVFLSNTFVVADRGECPGCPVSFDGGSSATGTVGSLPSTLSYNFDIIYPDSQMCGQASGEIVLPTEKLLLAGAKNVTYLTNSGNTQNILGESIWGTNSWNRLKLDTSVLAEGAYPLKALVTFYDDSQKSLDLAKDVVVDRTLPTAMITVPDGTSPVCPLRTQGTNGVWLGIEVKGMVADNIKVKNYVLSYGLGETPFYWLPAIAGSGSGQKEISGNGPVNGTLGIWNITNLTSSVFTLKLNVTDVAGNVSCFTRTISVDKEITIGSLAPSVKLFSPYNGLINGNLNLGFEIGEPVVVGLFIYGTTEDAGHALQLNPIPVRQIFNGLNYTSGMVNGIWDGRNEAGLVVPDGIYGTSIAAHDSCGNSAMKWIPVEVDATPPTVAISYPNTIDPLPPGNFIDVKGTASDKHFKSYSLECGQGDIPTEWQPVAGGSYPVNGASLGIWNTYGREGKWTLRLTSTDSAGNAGSTSTTIDLGVRKSLIKNLEPVSRVFSPNNDGKIDKLQVNYELTAGSDVKIEIFDSSGSVVSTYAVASAPTGISHYLWDGKNTTGATVADGLYQVRLTATLLSNTSVTQTEAINVTVDTTPPQVDIQQPADKAYLNTTSVAAIGTIYDPNLKEYAVSLSAPTGVQSLETGNQSRAAYTFGTVKDLVEGDYSITVNTSDQVENGQQTTRTFTVDRTPPKVTLDQPKNGDYFGATKNVIDITGLLVEKNLERYSLRYSAGDAPTVWKEVVGGDTVPTASKLSSLKVGKDDGVADGTYTISFYAKDKAGLEGEAWGKIVIDNTPPVVAISSLKNGDYVRGGLDIKGNSFDANLDKAVLEFSEGDCSGPYKGTAIKTLSSSVQDGVLTNWQAMPADGPYCLKLSAVDKVGNKAEAMIAVKVDTHSPAAPVLTGKIEEKTGVRLDWSKNGESDLAGYNLYRDGQKLNATLLNDTFYTDTNLKEGSYSYVVKALDLAGNESSASNTVTLRVDIMPPSVRINSPSEGGKVNDLIDVRGTAYSLGDFNEYRLSFGSGVTPSNWTLIRRSPLPVSSGQLAQWDTFGLAEGVYSLKLEGEDLSGNIAVHTITVSIDNTPPQTPVLLTAVATNSDVAVTWRANTEADLAGYLLYRNDQLANGNGVVVRNLKSFALTGTSYQDKGLPDGKYVYTLAAIDQAGNGSGLSNALSVTVDVRPPQATIVEPANNQKFGGKINVRAESVDNDIASIQFRYKKNQDAGWANLGGVVTASPYAVTLDLQALGMTYGDYQLQALATDQGGKTDPAPSVTTATYTDLTPPAPPTNLKIFTDGALTKISWDANTESDLDGYNIYRTSGTDRKKINTALVKQVNFQDVNLADGVYSYEITAADTYTNESWPSASVSAKIYAPMLTQPFTPISVATVKVAGAGADQNVTVDFYTTVGTAQNSAGSVLVDAQGNFVAETINLSLGENRITARAKDANGNISRMSDPVIVVYSAQPSAPTGLNSSVQDKTVSLAWNRNPETDVVGYNIYRAGVKINTLFNYYTPTIASSSVPGHGPNYAADWDWSTSWISADSYGSFTPAWLELDTRNVTNLVDEVSVYWLYPYYGKDFEIQAWSDSSWITLRKVVGNNEQYNQFAIVPGHRTSKIRINITDTNCTDANKQVGVQTAYVRSYGLVTPTSYQEQVADGTYAYKVSAVNYLGFESNASDEIKVEVGDVIPPAQPQGLNASASGSAISLTWTNNSDSDLAGYNVYHKTADGWTKLTATLVSGAPFIDQPLSNGTYTYRITAVDLVGNESIPSAEVAATVAVQVAPPKNLRATPAPAGKVIELGWDSPTDGTTRYSVFRSLTPGGPYSKVSNVPVNGLSFQDSGVVVGINYNYVVTALDPLGNESFFSNEASASLSNSALPNRPTLSYPTVPGVPINVIAPLTDIAGMAEPGGRVDLYRDGLLAGSAMAAAADTEILVGLPQGAFYPVFTPDKKWLAYYKDSTLWLKNMVTNEAAPITAPSGGSAPGWYPPAISPDGSKILFEYRVSNSPANLALYDLKTGMTTPFNNDGNVWEYSAVWFRDGKRVAFDSDRDGLGSLWIKNIETGEITLFSEGNYPDYIGISPDNRKIAFYEYPADGSCPLFVKNVTTGVTEQTITDTDCWSLSWSPDSRRLAYMNGMGDLMIYDVDTRAIQQLTASGANKLLPAWSPDSTHIALAESRIENPYPIWVVDLNGNQRLVREYSAPLKSLSWLSWGSLLCTTRDAAYSITPTGAFNLAGMAIEPGNNSITAIAVDESGTASLPSEAVSIYLDSAYLPDVGIAAGGITIIPAVPKPAEDVVVAAFITNFSQTQVDDVPVAVYLWDATGQLRLLKTETMSHLTPLSSVEVDTTITGGMAIGINSVIVVVDPENSIKEYVESNNVVTKDFFVTDREGVSLFTALDAAQYGTNQNLLAHVEVRNSSWLTAGGFSITIEDADGNQVASIDQTSVTVSYGLSNYSYSWNTGSTFAGSYRVRAIFTDSEGHNTESVTAFTILPDIRVEGNVSTDKAAYGASESVTVNSTITNAGSNYIIPQLKVKLRILDQNALELISSEKLLTTILPATSSSVSMTWNTGLTAPGNYLASLDVYSGDQVVSSKAAPFKVNPVYVLTGTVTGAPSTVISGKTFDASYTLQNRGNAATAGVIRVLLVDPESQVVVAMTDPIQINLAVNSSGAGSFTFSSTGLGLKTYQLKLQHEDQGIVRTIASSSVVVKDGLPPTITVISPVSANLYNAKVPVMVTVTDDVSGVEKVEYQIDGGGWVAMPLADPTTGRYATVWEADSKDRARGIQFKATDRAGNWGVSSETINFRPEAPPTTPSRVAPAQGSDVETFTPTLVVNNASDPNEDKLTYEFEMYADSGLTYLVATSGAAPEGAGTTSWQLPSALSENARYFWRVRAFDGQLYGPWMPTAAFRVNTLNDPPTAPTPAAPVDGGAVATVTPVLSINNAIDPDSPSLTYNFDVALDAEFSQMIASFQGIASGEGTTSWQVPVALQENQKYYWRAQADDWLMEGPWMTPATFFVNTTNEPPTVPTIVVPSNGSSVTSSALEIVASNSIDPDSPVLTYLFELDKASTFDSPNLQQSGNVQAGQGTTLWPVGSLKDNTTYHVRVKASDGLTESPWSGVNKFFVNTVNDPPTPPVPANPSNGAGVNVINPSLSIQNSTDLDNDVLTYEFEVYGDAALTKLVASVSNVSEALPVTSWAEPVALQENVTYYWRARAFDGQLYSTWTDAASFTVNTADDPPSAPTLSTPLAGSTVTTLTPTLAVFNAVDPDSRNLTYYFEIYSGNTVISSFGNIPESATGATSVTLKTPLADNTTYQWRSHAYDGNAYGPWMPMATFTTHMPVTGITAEIEFEPEILNQKSEGKWVTVEIELPHGYKASDIDIASIRLEGTVQAELKPYQIHKEHHDEDSLKVKFRRSAVIAVLREGNHVPVHVTGRVGAVQFEGVDVVRVIKSDSEHGGCR